MNNIELYQEKIEKLLDQAADKLTELEYRNLLETIDSDIDIRIISVDDIDWDD